MNRLRAVCIGAIKNHSLHYVMFCASMPYVPTGGTDFYITNIDATEGYRVFERYQLDASSKPSTLSDSWFQL
jgi:hypothetical protein